MSQTPQSQQHALESAPAQGERQRVRSERPVQDLAPFAGQWVILRGDRVVASNPDWVALRNDAALREGDSIVHVPDRDWPTPSELDEAERELYRSGFKPLDDLRRRLEGLFQDDQTLAEGVLEPTLADLGALTWFLAHAENDLGQMT